MKAVKNFCEDYAVLQTAANTFYKKHWKGVIVLYVGILGVGMLPYISNWSSITTERQTYIEER